MRKIVVLMVLGILAVSNIATADEFMPRKLEISSQDAYPYFVPGDDDISVTVTGGDAIVFIAVFSDHWDNNIKNVQTNHLFLAICEQN